MDRIAYAGLVTRLEFDAADHPTAFRNKVLLLSSAAYLVLFGALFGTAWLIYLGIDWARESHRVGSLIRLVLFGVIMLPMFFAVLRMFLMRLDPPQGRPITRDEAARLFEMLDKMRRKLKGPPIHHVLIDDQYNASITQLPRWGLFGAPTNYLVLGLPYMLGVPPKEMLATVAHEYGHLCGSHGKVGAWVYRQRRTFGALYAQVERSDAGNWVMGLIGGALHRFMPYYNAYTFVLSRQNEYDADRTATELFGAQVNASGLIRDALLGSWLYEVYFPRLFEQADTHDRPLFMPFAGMRTAIDANHDAWATRERLAEAWTKSPDPLDTHPNLRDRVEATGEDRMLPARADHVAGEALLGHALKPLIEEFDRAWWAREQPRWEARYQHVRRSKARLDELSAREFGDMLSHELQELALLKAEFESNAAAKPILEYMMRQSGGPFPKPTFYYGRVLLDEGNEGGLEYLRLAATKDHSLAPNAADAGHAFLVSRGRDEEARNWHAAMMQFAKPD